MIEIGEPEEECWKHDIKDAVDAIKDIKDEEEKRKKLEEKLKEIKSEIKQVEKMVGPVLKKICEIAVRDLQWHFDRYDKRLIEVIKGNGAGGNEMQYQIELGKIYCVLEKRGCVDYYRPSGTNSETGDDVMVLKKCPEYSKICL